MTIGGLKASAELVQINLSAGDSPPITAVFDRLARSRINMVFVTLSVVSGGFVGACAVSADSWPAAEPLLQRAAAAVEIVSPVGTLTVFPHRARTDLLDGVLNAFAAAGLPVYSIASSISAITFATDYRRLTQAVSVIRDIAQLPDNHAPLECPWCVKQV